MEQNNRPNYNIVTTTKSDKSIKKGLIIGALVVLFLAISIPAGVYLVKQQQDIREKAEETLLCPAAEACPVAGEPALLRSCSSVANGETPQDFSCSSISNVGVTASCGAVSYCCPSLGASWTTDLTLCAVTPSPTPTVTPTLVPTATATVAASASPTQIATASATPTLTPNVNATPTVTPTAAGAAVSVTPTANSTSSATPMPIPATGTDWPTLVGAGLGILVIIGSILLIL